MRRAVFLELYGGTDVERSVLYMYVHVDDVSLPQINLVPSTPRLSAGPGVDAIAAIASSFCTSLFEALPIIHQNAYTQ